MIGWLCTYTPEEIFGALGLESYRLYGDEQGGGSRADLVYLPVNFCPLARACLNEGLGERMPFTGFVLTASCHALVHLANAFGYAGERRGKELFVHLLDLPRSGAGDEAAVQAFAASLRALADHLGDFYGATWDEKAFTGALRVQQRLRLLLRELYRLRKERPERFRAAGVLEIIRTATGNRKEEFLPVLEGMVAALKGGVEDGTPEQDPPGLPDGLLRRGSPSGPRLLVAGSPLPFAYLDLIEELGGNIAGDDLCHGYRYCLPEVEEGPDPFISLARGYLGRVPCPRMAVGGDRLAYLLALARETGARGIVYHALKFCDPSLYEYPLLRDYFAGTGVSVLYLETEYRDAGTEQARTRIQAYLEMLG